MLADTEISNHDPIAPNSVLLVDDDLDFLECLTSQLQRVEGLRVDAVNNAREAAALLKKGNYNLVVSDWVLTPTTGPEWLKRADIAMKNTPTHKTPVIFISGSDRVALTRRMSPMANFLPVSFIHKASGAAIIVRMIREFLMRKPEPVAATQ